MILIDSSAWIEFLRDTGSPACDRVDGLLAEEFATCGPIRMEVLAGARDEAHLRGLEGLLARAATIDTVPADFDAAATWYRRCRRGGDTVRRMVDCLIAAHAIRNDLPLLHADRDFDALARHTPLRLDRVAG